MTNFSSTTSRPDYVGASVLAMTPAEHEASFADLHIGVVSVTAEGRTPLTMPIWYPYKPRDHELHNREGVAKAALIERDNG